MPFLDLPERGLRVFVRVNGSTDEDDDVDPRSVLDAAKPNLVLLHAALSSGQWCFAAQFDDPRLKATFNLVSFDFRFCGRTESQPRETFSLEDAADDALAILSALGLKKYSVLGHGLLGCHAATWLAIRSLAAAQSLILCSPSPLECQPEIRDMMLNNWVPYAMSNKPGNGGDNSGRIPAEALVAVAPYFFGQVGARDQAKHDAFLAHVQARYGPNRPAADMRHHASYFAHARIPDKLRAKIRCPVLLLQGTEDKTTSPIACAREWQAGFNGVKSGAQLVEVMGAPHLVLFFDSGIGSRIVWQFVRRAIAV